MVWRDLREWIAEIEKLGEMRVVEGATWQKDIGEITEMLDHTKDAPCVIFDNIPGYSMGYRVIVNCNGTKKRQAVTLGISASDVTHQMLLDRWEMILKDLKPIPPIPVDSAPVMENTVRGSDIDLELFPAPQWHPKDGGLFF